MNLLLGDQGIILPYYFPINQSTDILFKPKISLDQDLEFVEKYQLNSIIQNKTTGGDTSISIDSIKNENNENINTSLKIETEQVISKNSIFSASGLFTNSISTTRSINEKPIAFEDIYLRLENYNFIKENDYLRTELSSVETFETTDLNSIPVSPSLNYINIINSENYTMMNNLNFIILKRDNSSASNPSESFKIKLENEFSTFVSNDNLSFFNKFNVNNSYSDYYFKNKKSLNHDSLKSNLSISSDLYYTTSGFSHQDSSLLFHYN